MGFEDDPEANIKPKNGFASSNGGPKTSQKQQKRRFFGSKSPQDPKVAKNMNTSFCEHTWDVDRCEGFFKDSNINVRNPEQSKGLTKSQAEHLLEKHGPNELPKPKEMSDLELFLRQFLNLLWVVLAIASTLTLAGFFANTSDLTSLWVTIILYVMIVVMCFISFYQEREARRVTFN
uniref:Cation-transporting P-type ATPase N-terminal domain-containing protein n=1 Tax=Acrobeloides nanus TaxID=290746 RepID=A0A914BV26_9BILA